METQLLPVSGLALMLVLGLRHGLDPDHIAMIDNMVYRTLDARPASRVAPWAGTLFALGHGLTVTAIAVLVGEFTAGISVPAALRLVIEWLPALLLIAVGTLNVVDLLNGQRNGQGYQPRGWKRQLLPARLRDSSHPLAMVATGIVFALVFETATQAVFWAYATAAGGGSAMALLAGLVFTGGMAISDTVDSRLMVRLLRQASARAGALRYRRAVGWVVVALSYTTALYAIVTREHSALAVNQLVLTSSGIALVVGALLGYLCLARKPAAAGREAP